MAPRLSESGGSFRTQGGGAQETQSTTTTTTSSSSNSGRASAPSVSRRAKPTPQPLGDLAVLGLTKGENSKAKYVLGGVGSGREGGREGGREEGGV